jgi:hypothetical protein
LWPEMAVLGADAIAAFAADVGPEEATEPEEVMGPEGEEVMGPAELAVFAADALVVLAADG